jgi:hypothetical protein
MRLPKGATQNHMTSDKSLLYQCIKCLAHKPHDQYRQHKGWADHRDRWCIQCRVRGNKIKSLERSPYLGMVCWFEKPCRICGITKPLDKFPPSQTMDGRESRCRACKSAQFRNKHHDRILEKQRKRMKEKRATAEGRKEAADRVKKWKEKNRGKVAEQHRRYRLAKGMRPRTKVEPLDADVRIRAKHAKRLLRARRRSPTCGMTPMQRHHWRMANDPQYVINCRMRVSIRKAMKGRKAGRRWELLVGYTVDDLIKHLERQLPKGRSMQDLLAGRLHIDHIVPKSLFDVTKEDELRVAWRINEQPVGHNGEQPRKPVWRRAGRRVAGEVG